MWSRPVSARALVEAGFSASEFIAEFNLSKQQAILEVAQGMHQGGMSVEDIMVAMLEAHASLSRTDLRRLLARVGG